MNLFSGGALSKCTIFALGIMPYITASIIFQLLGVVWPYIEKLQKEGGAEGRKKIVQYTRYLTIFICVVQSLGISFWLKNLISPAGKRIVENPSVGYHILTVIVLTAGSTFIMWLGEQITARGIGNGISLMIYAGIVVGLIPAIVKTFEQVQQGNISIFVVHPAVGLHAGRGGLHRLLRAGPAEDPHPVRQAHGGPEDGGRPGGVLPAQAQPGRRHAHHLRRVPAGRAADDPAAAPS